MLLAGLSAAVTAQQTVQLEIFEPKPGRTVDWGNWHASAAYRAKGSFIYVARKLLTGLYFVGWFAVFWIPALIVLYFLTRWARRRIAVLLIPRPRTFAPVQESEQE